MWNAFHARESGRSLPWEALDSVHAQTVSSDSLYGRHCVNIQATVSPRPHLLTNGYITLDMAVYCASADTRLADRSYSSNDAHIQGSPFSGKTPRRVGVG